jgi:molybdenum cofactor guanylyltransferase
MTDRFTGAVLTGGASRRLGLDKALVEVGGRSLAECSAAALRGAGAAEVVAVGGDLEVLAALPSVDRAVPDRHPGEGPLGGLLTAFAESSDDVVVVLACDVPGITAGDVSRLLDALRSEPHAAVAHAVVDGRVQPLTAAWRTSLARHELRRAFDDGERAPRVVFERFRRVEVTSLPSSAVDDIDSVDDLHRYASAGSIERNDMSGGLQDDNPEIDIDRLAELLDTGIVLIDVREDDEVAEGHVPGIVHIALATVPDNLDRIPTDVPVYVICAAGGRSANAVRFLRAQGVDATNVAGGTNAWISSGRAVDRPA